MKSSIQNFLKILDRLRRSYRRFLPEENASSPRFKIIQWILVSWILIIIFRLFQLQIFLHTDMSRLANNQQMTSQPIIAKRGKIIDRNGFSLAESIETSSLAVRPSFFYPQHKKVGKQINWGEPDRSSARYVANLLSPLIGMEPGRIENKLLTKKPFVYIARPLSPEVTRQVESKGVSRFGLTLEKVFIRSYPKGTYAAQIVGFTDIDGEGKLGMEQIYNDLIRGQNGERNVYVDGRKRLMVDNNRITQEPIPGFNLELTLDSTIQRYAEEALTTAVAKSRPKSAYAIIVNPNTGEILGAASYPTFDPNLSVTKSKMTLEEALAARKFHAVEDGYEPGSTMKVFTVAMALEENLVNLEESIDCRGPFRTPFGQVITDHGKHGFLKVNEVLAKSSNIGTAKIGIRLPREDFYSYLDKFGFGQPSGLGVPGEIRTPILPVKEWSGSTQYTLTYGYALLTSPLHVLMAGSAIANGGILMKPMLVKNIFTEDGSIIKTFPPEEKKRVISEKTSALMRDILQDVVLEGTAKRAKLDGVGSFGKTGTSYKRVNGRQNDNRHQYASYMGFFPADKPQYGILVMLDDAQSGGDGGDIAAPAFKQIADNIIRYKKTPTNISANNLPITLNLGNWPDPSIEEWIPDSNKVPDLKGLSLKVALQRIVASGGTPRVSLGNKQAKIHKIQSQDPVPHADLEKGQIIKVITESP